MMRVPPHRILRPAVLLSALVCSATFHVAQATEPAAGEPEMLRSLGIPPQMAVRYQDESGRSMTREAFHERLSASAGKLSLVVRKSEQEAVLQLQPAGQLTGGGRYKVAAGEPLPAFSLRSLDQAALTPEALKGRYTLMSFYFAGCGPCVAEVPALNGLQARMPELGLAAVTFDDEATSRRFVQEHGLRWPVYPQARAFLQSLGVSSYPAFALLNPAGRLVSIGPLHELQRSGDPAELLRRWVQEQIARDSGKT